MFLGLSRVKQKRLAVVRGGVKPPSPTSTTHVVDVLRGVKADKPSGLRLALAKPDPEALHLNKIPKTNRFRGVKADQSAQVGQVNPSSIQTITVGLGISPGHTHLPILSDAKDLLVGCTTDRELHPAPKVVIQLR
jgi:hypothetical protein